MHIMHTHTHTICMPLVICTRTHTLLAAPPSKKQKKEKKSKVEKAIEKTINVFMKSQADAEERFQKREEERWKKEMELEEKQRREDRQHQLQMMQMLGQMIQGRPYPPQAYSFDYD